ncbi:Type I restriction-modification system, specificity subunit S [uncultured Gammaproteobacteria bacterium]|jgi:type I restriction enzyme S subunit|nr:Type I restriction-modification system, specificity subunit S [uncultured Gammaproteobacteria bacterium]CAC9967387.1 Type I restriction-modification system, specificity subunit S [uncultured Gammaproteobacteria bacterium]
MSALLEFIQYKDFNIWDVKQYLSTLIYSDYEIVSLGKHINAETTKVKPFESPQEDFKILGVNNKTGIFDNEIKKGSEINQPYKIVQNDFLAFNPYRINVGSIGLKTKEQKYNLISPAYVVFSCKKELLSEYLFLIFKTKLFNEVIRENTRGSVRQILAFDILETLKIPLPPLETQKIIVKRYQDKLNLAKQQNQQAQQKEAEIETYLYQELGIELPKNEKNNNLLQFVGFKDLQEWSVKNLLNSNIGFLNSNKFDMRKLSNILSINPQTSFKNLDENLDISFIPMKYIDAKKGEVVDKNMTTVKNSIGYTNFIDNDLLWARITPCMQNGKSAIVNTLKNGLGCGSTEYHVLRNNKTDFNLVFLYHILRSNIVLTNAMNYFTGSAGQQRVPKEFLENLQIPLPPLEIQNKIAKRIQGLKDDIKNLKQQAEQNQQLALSEFEVEIFNVP